jgi:hypothetical protein
MAGLGVLSAQARAYQEQGGKPVPQAASNARPPRTSLPIEMACARLLEVCPRAVVKSTIMRALVNGQIHVAHTGRVGTYGPEDPAADKPAFWQADPRGPTVITPFPWPKNTARRKVSSRIIRPSSDWRKEGYRLRGKVPMASRVLADYACLGLTVIWEEWLAVFPTAVQKAWTAQAGTSNDQEQPTGKDRVIAIAKNMKADGAISASISKTDFAKELARRSGHDNPKYYRTIRTHAADWGIWPIDSI